MKKTFVSIEGIDYVGKTTNAQNVAKAIGGVYFKSPSERFESMREVFNNGDQTSKFLFYLATLVQGSNDIELLLDISPVVVDRYLFTTICYHAYTGVRVEMIDLKQLPIIKPDLNVCLTTTKEEWLKQSEERDGKERASKEEENWGKWQFISNMLAGFTRANKGIVIDNTKQSAEETTRQIVAELKARNLI